MKNNYIIFLIMAVSVVLNSGCEKKPPSPEIVATYDGGTITKQELRKNLHEIMPRCQQDYICPEHGLRHELCNDKEKCEKYDPHHDQFETPQVYKYIIENMVINQMARKNAGEKKIDKKDDFKHAIKHIDEQIALNDIQSKVYEKEIKVSETEIQKYYDQNKQEFTGKTLNEVKEDIKQRLKPKVEEKYVSEYIKGLEEKASITKNYQLLIAPQLLGSDLFKYYQENKDKYYQPEAADINQITIGISGDENKTKQNAEKALQLIRSGERWDKVKKEYSEKETIESEKFSLKVEKRLMPNIYDENVFKLTSGEISGVFKDENKYFIVRLIRKYPGRQKELSEVKEQIKLVLQQDNEKKYYEENKNNTLFTIHGEPYTLGVFLEELNELPQEEKLKYNTVEEKKELLNRLIQRLLLVEAARDEITNPKSGELGEKVKTSVLRQMLHQEEVDENMKVDDKDVEKFYKENALKYRLPAKTKISYIRIDKGKTLEEQKKASRKIEDACSKLNPGWGRKGIDFAQAAKEYSQDPNAEQGGAVDRWFVEGQYLQEEISIHPLHELIFSLSQGQISEPFDFRDSWWIIQAREKEESKALEFTEVKDRVKQELIHKKHSELTFEKEKRLLKRANLVIYNSAVKAILKEEKSKSEFEQKDESNSSIKKEE